MKESGERYRETSEGRDTSKNELGGIFLGRCGRLVSQNNGVSCTDRIAVIAERVRRSEEGVYRLLLSKKLEEVRAFGAARGLDGADDCFIRLQAR